VPGRRGIQGGGYDEPREEERRVGRTRVGTIRMIDKDVKGNPSIQREPRSTDSVFRLTKWRPQNGKRAGEFDVLPWRSRAAVLWLSGQFPLKGFRVRERERERK
jgi:hypothetical protein